jgi:hypothetical protein
MKPKPNIIVAILGTIAGIYLVSAFGIAAFVAKKLKEESK